MMTQSLITRIAIAHTHFEAVMKATEALRALDVLIDYLAITAILLRKILEISASSTKTALEPLQAEGVLVEHTGYARNRIFSASEIMAIIN